MKTIICPTDFSKNADKALDFAVDIAKKAGAELIVLNAFDLPYSQNVMTTSLIEIMKETSEKGLNEIKKSLSAKGVECTTISRMGNPIRVIKDFSEKYAECMIVMGTKGATGLEEVLIGSNAASTLHIVNVPVLTIPRDSEIIEIKKIVYATDYLSNKDERALQRLATLVKVYNAELMILHVNDGKTTVEPKNDKFTKVFKDTKISFHEIEAKKGIDEEIINFANANDANMVSLLARRYGFVEGLFHSSKTSKIAYKTNRPFLALHETR